jgi:DNA-binding NarL/FixJ family response regulator
MATVTESREGSSRSRMRFTVGRCGFAVAGRAGDAEELLDLVRTHAPRLIIGDIRMPPMSIEGLEAARAIREEFPLAVLGPREREALGSMAGRHADTGIARQLWVTEGTVGKHLHSILTRLALPETDDDHRQLLAVVTCALAATIVHSHCRRSGPG